MRTRVIDQQIGQLPVLSEQLAQGRQRRLSRVHVLLGRRVALQARPQTADTATTMIKPPSAMDVDYVLQHQSTS